MAESFAIVYHRDALKYDFGPGHPFRADRFTKFMERLEGLGVLADPRSDLVEPNAATDTDLLLIHTRDYLEEVKARAKACTPLSGDTPLNSSIVEGGLAVVGSSLKAAELIAEGKVKVAEAVGGGLHHAGRSYGGGFCVCRVTGMNGTSGSGLHLVRFRFDTRSSRPNQTCLECGIESVLDAFRVRWVQVPVAIHRHDDARVPEMLLHDLRV